MRVLDNINSASVDLIYLDPPFNSNRTYSAPVGSAAAGASFKDAWTLDDIDVEWVGQISERHPHLAAIIEAVGAVGGKGDKSYLIFMARRLLEMHRILKQTGSLFLHCDSTMSHSLKLVLDAVFGRKNFRNEIAWCYQSMSSTTRDFPRKHDYILRYAKSESFIFNGDDIRVPYKNAKMPDRKNKQNRGGSGKWKGASAEERAERTARGKLPADWWHITFGPTSPERTGYPTQKPLALLERIIKAASNKGDVVLDPFCGCATAMVAAERLERQWIGIDISDKAVDLIRMRLKAEEQLWRQVGNGRYLNPLYEPPTRTDNAERMVNEKEYKHVLYGIQQGNCALCGHHFQFQNLTNDHIQPRAHGGQSTEDNLQLLCSHCNSIKGIRSMEWARAALKKAGITIKSTTIPKRTNRSRTSSTDKA